MSEINRRAPAGAPSHIELGVADRARAQAFYGSLFNWKIQDMGEGGFFVDAPTCPIGVHGKDATATFVVYFAVSDIDAALARVRELGGKTEGHHSDNTESGRYAECEDDQGVRFGLHQPPAWKKI
jgi:predicted enzyme related to lactoylglutathione lyase